MPKPPKADVIVWGPGNKFAFTRLPIVMGAVTNYDERWAVMIGDASPAVRRGASRVLPWSKETPIVSIEYGDGEALDHKAGVDADWRATDEEMSDQDYNDLDDMASERALMMAYEAHMNQNSIWWPISTMAAVAVAVVLFLATLGYVQAQGGIGNVIGGLNL